MSDEPENLAPRHLRRLDEKLDHVGGKLDEVVRRLGTLDRTVASPGTRLARMFVRMAGVERRPDLVEGHS